MIEILNKEDCCGCWACANVCPKKCITMREDDEGFLYPYVDRSLCIDCHLCEKVCPCLHLKTGRTPLAVFAAYNTDEEVRLSSSSGGVFTMLAESIIADGGVVFGAGFNDEWQVIHSFTDNSEGLKHFRGSKYVQSVIGNTYSQVREYLSQGLNVLFTGTPCQISGLNNYLKKEYPNLLTLDFICHGVPSPGVFRSYLKEIMIARGKLEEVKFRDKVKGWRRYSLTLDLCEETTGHKYRESRDLTDSPFLRGFLKDLYLRPSCHACPSKNLNSGSDITLGDYWGCQVMEDNDKGISAVVINTEKGMREYKRIMPVSVLADFGDLTRRNPALHSSSRCTNARSRFYKAYGGQAFESIIDDVCRPTIIDCVLVAYRQFRKTVAKVIWTLIRKQ